MGTLRWSGAPGASVQPPTSTREGAHNSRAGSAAQAGAGSRSLHPMQCCSASRLCRASRRPRVTRPMSWSAAISADSRRARQRTTALLRESWPSPGEAAAARSRAPAGARPRRCRRSPASRATPAPAAGRRQPCHIVGALRHLDDPRALPAGAVRDPGELAQSRGPSGAEVDRWKPLLAVLHGLDHRQNAGDGIVEVGQVEGRPAAVDAQVRALDRTSRERRNHPIRVVFRAAVDVRKPDDGRGQAIIPGREDQVLTRGLGAAVDVDRPQSGVLGDRKTRRLAVDLAAAGEQHPRLGGRSLRGPEQVARGLHVGSPAALRLRFRPHHARDGREMHDAAAAVDQLLDAPAVRDVRPAGVTCRQLQIQTCDRKLARSKLCRESRADQSLGTRDQNLSHLGVSRREGWSASTLVANCRRTYQDPSFHWKQVKTHRRAICGTHQAHSSTARRSQASRVSPAV